MIFKKDDLIDLEEFLNELSKNDYYMDLDPISYFGERPYLLFPQKFNESRKLYFEPYLWDIEYDYEKGEWEDDIEDEFIDFEKTKLYKRIRKAITDTDIFLESIGVSNKKGFMNGNIEYAFQKSENGAWYWFDGIQNSNLYLHGYDTVFIDTQELLQSIENSIKQPDHKPNSIIYPRSYVDLNYRVVNKYKECTIKTLSDLQNGKKSLLDINPYEFEDIVAELLENLGLDIFKTPKSNDGGRDLVARGEISPGIPIHIAIEVKRKKKVNIPDLRNALYANRNYPKLMFFTAGTFSAGVYSSREYEENQFRLELRDGIAISQLINGYFN